MSSSSGRVFDMLGAGSRPGSPATEPQQVCGGTKLVSISWLEDGQRLVLDRSTRKVTWNTHDAFNGLLGGGMAKFISV